jgi:cell wall-associated NlpC family hydrolase
MKNMITNISWKLCTLGLAIASLGFLSACSSPDSQQSTNPSTPTQASPASVISSSPPASSESAPPATKTATTATAATTTAAIPGKPEKTTEKTAEKTAEKTKESQKSESSELRRVNFAAGSNSTSLEGQLGKYAAVKYVLGSSKGQSLRASVSGCEKVTLALSYLDKADGPLPIQPQMNEERTNLKTTLTSSGDYIIQVQNGDYPSCKYNLSIGIQ